MKKKKKKIYRAMDPLDDASIRADDHAACMQKRHTLA
jgi:hypothetical protein